MGLLKCLPDLNRSKSRNRELRFLQGAPNACAVVLPTLGKLVDLFWLKLVSRGVGAVKRCIAKMPFLLAFCVFKLSTVVKYTPLLLPLLLYTHCISKVINKCTNMDTEKREDGAVINRGIIARQYGDNPPIEVDSSPSVRYYFWEWCKPYGWRQMGRTDGYATKAGCLSDNQWGMENSGAYKIMKAR